MADHKATVTANSVPFGEICNMLEQILKKKKPDKKKVLLKYTNDFKINVDKDNSTFYPILRLLVPKYERERKAYDMKEHALGRLLVKVLSLNKQSHDAEKLLKPEGDFANIAYFVFKNGVCQNSSKLNVGDVNDLLDRIANAEVGFKGPILDEIFSYAMKSLTAIEMKWFLRIILKDLKIGVSSNEILGCYHPDAPELYNACSNLSKVCEELDDTKLRPMEMGIRVFYAVNPMLSERLDVSDVGQLPRAEYQIEEKFDGERFQMHMENGKFEYFSRRGYSFTAKFGDTYDNGFLTPLLKDCFSPNVTSFILDGEMMGWNKDRQCFGSKGMAFDIKKITENSKFRPCYCVFDVIYYNGKSLVGPPSRGGVPLSERLRLLDTMFTDTPGVIMHSKRRIVKKSSDILEALNKAIESQDEGIVIKDTESYYIAKARNAGWYKIKPEYTEGATEDLDLVIIGVDKATEARQGRAKSFVVACADSTTPGGIPDRWLCVGRVATGLSHEQHELVCNHLQKHWKERDRVAPPPSLVFNKIHTDYWIMPHDSVVVEVRATELIRSTDFATSHTLRFPRIKKLREDKPVNDILTLAEFNSLISNKGSVQKMATKRINETQIGEFEVKVRKRRAVNVPEVPTEFKTKPSDVAVTSRALAGRKIWIVSDDDDCRKEELMKIVESHGGKPVANIGTDTWVSVVGRMTVRATNLLSQGADVTTTAWLRSLPPSDSPTSLSPLDMLSMKRETRLKLARDYDAFGDSYTELIDEDVLRKCFQKMDAHEPPIYLTRSEMIELDKELFEDGYNPHSFLRNYNIHFVNTDNNILVLQAKLYGAKICDITSTDLTHVIVPRDMESIDVLKAKCCDNARFVREDWLEMCFEEERPVGESSFLL